MPYRDAARDVEMSARVKQRDLRCLRRLRIEGHIRRWLHRRRFLSPHRRFDEAVERTCRVMPIITGTSRFATSRAAVMPVSLSVYRRGPAPGRRAVAGAVDRRARRRRRQQMTSSEARRHRRHSASLSPRCYVAADDCGAELSRRRSRSGLFYFMMGIFTGLGVLR